MSTRGWKDRKSVGVAERFPWPYRLGTNRVP